MPIFLVRHLVYGILLLALAACSDRAVQTIRLAHISYPGYEALSLAKSRGFYNNLNVTTYRPENNAQSKIAFKNNIVDVIAVTLIEAIELQIESPESLSIIAVLDISNGGDVIIANKDIKSIKQLGGKRLGIEPSAFGAFFISRALDFYPNLSVNKIQIVPVQPENHEKMFLADNIDAVATYEPAKSAILKQKGHIIFDSSRIPNEIVDVLVTRSSFAKKNPQAIRGLLKGYFAAIEFIKQNPNKAITYMSEYENIDTKEFKQSLLGLHLTGKKENIVLLNNENRKLFRIAKKTRDFLKDKKIIINKNNALPEISDLYLVEKKMNIKHVN